MVFTELTYRRASPAVCHDMVLRPLGAPISEKDGGSQFQHIRWMLKQLPQFIEEGKTDKINRWLGFIQGVLWLEEYFSIDDMRDHNKI